ncbi:CLC_0170 family protein [Paenibacillus antarcticus]|uniref:Uncharacterized protein n=1 Tax=Paenibacillus antarcticus TaxID=253703 RepID=A0A168JAK9_9BACL|nr:CLC_0170 family protein [Paenibacillus antarcticus]OAB40365.1 hypothetical protein PBAT_23975 [Paenibacillus antarcticus]
MNSILSSASYIVALFVLSGVFLLAIDCRIYRMKDMQKEQHAARNLGYTQLCLSVILSSIAITYYYMQ